MNQIEKELTAYGKECFSRPDESKVKDTIVMAKKSFYENAVRHETDFLEFMCQQIRFIRKRWWMLQFLSLLFAALTIRETGDSRWVQRMLCVAATLFVIFLMPELWKNRSANMIEVEETAYYSLRQIYAARLLIFAAVDGMFVSCFAGVVVMTASVSIWEIVIQFFLPMTVTCSICLRTLCSRYIGSEYPACFLSLACCYVWVRVILSDQVYDRISMPLWITVCCMALFYLTYVVRKIIRENDADFIAADSE